MGVTRRNVFVRLVAAVAAGSVAWKASEALAQEDGVPNVAYHLSDNEKVGFVIGNILNHIEGMGGPDKVHIELVVHGPALAQFRKSKADPDLTRRLEKISGFGVELGACGNTLDAQEVGVADLLPGFVRIDEGGVVRLAQLQAWGYAYLRP
jgi:intracellular sulfur oxidation DsrE/DsrF family protein